MRRSLMMGIGAVAGGIYWAWPRGESCELFTFVGWLSMVAGGFLAGLSVRKGGVR